MGIKFDNESIQVVDVGWTTIADLKNKLILHVALNVTKFQVDGELKDPDGIPLVWVEGKYVTRVRRMTDQEFEGFVRRFGYSFNVEMKVAEWAKKEEENKVKEVRVDGETLRTGSEPEVKDSIGE